MPAVASRELTQELKKLRAPLDAWRRSGRAPRRIPDKIWDQATVLAAEHGVGVVARGLGIDHAKLKAKVLAYHPAVTALAMAEPEVEPTFVELLQTTPRPVSTGHCILEVDSHRGSRLRVNVELDICGLSTLLRDFGS